MAMAEQQDQEREAVRDALNAALAGVARDAQRQIVALEERQAAGQSALWEDAAELRAQFNADRAAALAVLAPVSRDEWWDTAQPEQIAEAYQTAHAWEKFDPQAWEVADRIRSELGERYEVGPTGFDQAAQRESQEEALMERYGIDPLTLREAEGRQWAAEADGYESDLDVTSDVAPGVHVDVDVDFAQSRRADTEHDVASRQRGDAPQGSAGQAPSALEGGAGAGAVSAWTLAAAGQGEAARRAAAQPPNTTAARESTARGLTVNQAPGPRRGA